MFGSSKSTRKENKEAARQISEETVEKILAGELKRKNVKLSRTEERALRIALLNKARESGKVEETRIRESAASAVSSLVDKLKAPVVVPKDKISSAIASRTMPKKMIVEHRQAVKDELDNLPKGVRSYVLNGKCANCHRKLMVKNLGSAFCERSRCNRKNLLAGLKEIGPSVDDLKESRKAAQAKLSSSGGGLYANCGCNVNGIYHNCKDLYGHRMR